MWSRLARASSSLVRWPFSAWRLAGVRAVFRQARGWQSARTGRPSPGGVGSAAQGAVGVVDAGDEGPQVHVRVVAGHNAAQAGFVSDDLAVEGGVPGELGEPGLGAGWPSQRRAVFVGAHLGEKQAAGEGLLGFDLIAEAGVAGAGVALEHLNALVAVLQGSRDGAAGAAGDQPGQGPPELARGQPRQLAPFQGIPSGRLRSPQ